MLEIILLYFLCRRMGRLMREKGRPPLKYQILVPVVWILGAFVGAGIHVAFHGAPDPQEINLYLYLIAALVAIFSVGVLFIHAKALPPLDGKPRSVDDVRDWR